MPSPDELYTNPAYAKLTPANFALYCSGGRWKMARHLALLNRELVEIASGRNKRLLVSMPPRPQPLDSKILMADGTYKPLANISVGEEVISHKGIKRKVLEVIDAGVQPIITFNSSRGMPIKVAETHPVGIYEQGWKEAKYVLPSDRLVSIYNVNIENPVHLEPNLAFTLGLFTFTGKLIKGETECGSKLFGNNKIPSRYHCDYFKITPNSNRGVKLTPKGQSELVRIGWQGSRKIAEIAYNLDDETFVNFAVGLLCSENKTTDHIRQMAICPDYLHKLHLLLLRYGFLTQCSITDRGVVLNISQKPTVRYLKEMFSGEVTKRQSDGARYVDYKITSIVPSEPEPCICLVVDVDASYISEGYVVHNSGKCVEENQEVFKCDGKPIKIKDITENTKVFSVGADNLLHEDKVLHKIASGVKQCYEVTLFDGKKVITSEDHKFLTSDGYKSVKDLKPNVYVAVATRPEQLSKIRWVKLIKITEVGQRPTYDLEIEKYNNFICNNIVVHNSELVSKYFPAWYLGAFPNNQLIFSTYEAHFAAEFGGAARDLLTEYGQEVFGINVREGSAAASRWKIEDRLGIMQCAGVGGPLTGKGADVLIIDDPIKNDQEAESLLMRNKIFNWFGATASTRLMPGGSIVVVMTRWHHDDLIGRLLEKMNNEGGEKYKYLKFSAISNEHEEPWPKGLGRKPGEALWPEMWPIESMEKIKNSGALSSYYWSALYQQEPAPEGGGIFKQKWFRYFTTQGDYYLLEDGQGNTKYVDDKKCFKIVTVDTANKVKDTSDYTAIGVWVITPDSELLLVHLIRDRIGYDEIMKKLIHTNVFFKPRYIGIENMGIAIQLIIEARNKGLPVRELEPGGKGKQNRANMPLGAVIRMENGKVFFPKHAPYITDIELELLTFPKAKNDEIVDILSYACNEMTKFDIYDNDDFLPYSLDQALPIGMRKPGGFGF